MNHMNGRFAVVKRRMYQIFIAEKEGYVPDEVGVMRVQMVKTIAALYIAFLTWYLYKHALIFGEITTLYAVSSFRCVRT